MFEVLHLWAPILNAFLLLGVLGGVIHMFLRSRRWTAPAQDMRIKNVEDEQHVIRGNLKRVERDFNLWHREAMETNEQMLRELRAIQMNGAKEHPLEEELKTIEDRLLDLEQALALLPCGADCLPLKERKK